MKEIKNKVNTNKITEGSIFGQLLLFFFPILFGTFFQQLYNTADAVVVGRFVGKQALAAVGGTTSTLINLLVGFFVGLSSGATVVISQFYGARKPDKVHWAVHTAVAFFAYRRCSVYDHRCCFCPYGSFSHAHSGRCTYICGCIHPYLFPGYDTKPDL